MMRAGNKASRFLVVRGRTEKLRQGNGVKAQGCRVPRKHVNPTRCSAVGACPLEFAEQRAPGNHPSKLWRVYIRSVGSTDAWLPADVSRACQFRLALSRSWHEHCRGQTCPKPARHSSFKSAPAGGSRYLATWHININATCAWLRGDVPADLESFSVSSPKFLLESRWQPFEKINTRRLSFRSNRTRFGIGPRRLVDSFPVARRCGRERKGAGS